MSSDVLERYPQVRGQPIAMAMLAGALREMSHYADALALGRAALDQAPQDMEVRDLVASALGRDVFTYHIPMLHDAPRNRAYAEAIRSAVRPGMTVLEIGTGAGFLSLVAARAGAEVVTCEGNPMVAAAAAEIAARNGLADRITVIPKRSQDLVLGVDLPERADLFMSELFDRTLFGDEIVPVIADARERLLKPGAPVLPRWAELRCALVSMDFPERRRPLGEVEGFDMSPFNLLAPRPADVLKCANVNARPGSEPASLLCMDFEGEPPFGPVEDKVALASLGGRIDGVAQWLKFDFGGGVTYENSPFSGIESHWGQPVHPLIAPVETRPGDVIEVSVKLVGSQLRVNASPRP